jgi:WD40 repeat protein
LSRLGLYQQLLQEKALKFDNSDEQFQLLLTGLVTKKQNQLEIYNPIYKDIFNEDWLNFYLVDLYPNDYNNAKKAWLSSQKSSQFLLEGESLANAQIWAENKKLSSLDYQFLAACQKEQDERSNQVLQEANKRAEELLIQAKQKANKIVKGTLAITGIILIGASTYAYYQIQRANQITYLEKKNNVIQKYFSTNQLDSLLEAIAAGQNLKNMVNHSQSITQYPTVSPLSVLLSTIRQIEVKNEINLDRYRGDDPFNRFSQKGDWIVSIASPDQIQLWNNRGKLLKTIQVPTTSGKDSKIKNLELSPDGQLIAVLMSDNTLLFFDQNGEAINYFKSPQFQNSREQFTPKFIRFSPDSKKLAIILSDQEGKKGQLLLWSMTENKAKMLTSKSIPSIQSLSFSPDNQSIAVGSVDGSIRIWKNTEIEPQIIIAHNGDVNSLAFNFESKILASGGQDGCLNFWQKQGKNWQNFSTKKCDLSITDLKFSPINQTLAILRKGGQLSQLIEDSSGKKFAQLISLSKEGQSYSQLFFSLDGHYFQSFQSGLIRVWQLSKPPAISRLIFSKKCPNVLTAIADNPQAGVTVLGDENGNFCLLNKKGEILQSIPGKIQSKIKGIFWLSDFQQLWTVTGTGLIEKWSYQNQKLTDIKQLEYPQEVADVKFDSKTGNLFLLEEEEEGKGKGEKSKLTYFNLDQQNTGSLQGVQTIAIPKKIADKQIKKIAVQSNGSLMAMVDKNNDLQIWNRETKKSYILDVLNLNVNHLDFSPDGKLLAISYQDNSKNGTLQLWKINDNEGSELLTIAEKDIVINDFDFRANNNLLKGIDANGYLQTYNFNLDDLLTQSCDWLKDYLDLHPDKRKSCQN